MENCTYVHRDVALSQSFGGKWGVGSMLISVFALGLVLLMIRNAPAQETSFNALMLYWFSGIFILIGLHQAHSGFSRLRKTLKAKRNSKLPLWQHDYHWQTEGMAYNSKKKLLREHLKVLFFMFFLSPFVYLVFIEEAETTALWVKLVVSLFIVAGGFLIYSLRTTWQYHLRYGSSFLQWHSFPLEPGIPCSLELTNPRLLKEQQSLDVSIRYIQEVWVTSGSGKSRSSKLHFKLVHEYRQSYNTSKGRLPLHVCLPPEAPTNAMASKAAYWELVVHNYKDLKFHPYLAWFFLPVYPTHEINEKSLV